jgi:hypothetical protein
MRHATCSVVAGASYAVVAMSAMRTVSVIGRCSRFFTLGQWYALPQSTASDLDS